jgi:hypothetical protein
LLIELKPTGMEAESSSSSDEGLRKNTQVTDSEQFAFSQCDSDRDEDGYGHNEDQEEEDIGEPSPCGRFLRVFEAHSV